MAGGSFKKLSMRRLIEQYPIGHPSRGGVCRGATLMHSGLRAQAQNLKNVQDSEKHIAACANFASKIQEDQEGIKGLGLTEALAALYRRHALAVSLKLVGPIETFTWNCARQLTMLAEGAKFNRVQIALPNHFICMQMVGGNCEIFDPNYGALQVPVGKTLQAFGFVYSCPPIMKQYELAAGSEIHVAVLR